MSMGGAASLGLAIGASSSASGRRRIRSPIRRAAPSDHAAIACFLDEALGQPAAAALRASIQDPFYEPRDRLLLRRGGRIIAHVHLTHRVMQFGRRQIPVAGLDGLAIAPSCRSQGLGAHLLAAAEQQMARSGALLGLLRTSVPHFFRRSGWAFCGPPDAWIAGTHAVLSRLLDRGLRPSRQPRLHIRPWRRWEERGLMRVYNQNLPGSYGPVERTRAYWRWLLERHAFDQLYVALDGPNLWDLEEQNTQIVGYMAVRGGRILELMTTPRRAKPAVELLARACGDAIEQDRHAIVLCAPARSPLVRIFGEAAGWRQPPEADDGQVTMARLLDPVALLKRLGEEFCGRAAAAGLPRPLELGLLVEGRKYQVEVSRAGARSLANHMGRSYLRLNVADFTRLVLGQLDWATALGDGRVVPSTALARHAGQVLFPPLPLWCPPLDDPAA
jgi:predicted N-acetyltransferase YhbS